MKCNKWLFHETRVKIYKKILKDGIEVKAYKGIICKYEIGTIMVEKISTYYQIKYFRVRENYRQLGVGKKLLNAVLQEIENREVIVYPNSEAYSGETPIENETLYTIYEHLGFQLEEEYVDRKKANERMKLIKKN